VSKAFYSNEVIKMNMMKVLLVVVVTLGVLVLPLFIGVPILAIGFYLAGRK
jgi:hypothetical protein